jgi:hypothetical protein
MQHQPALTTNATPAVPAERDLLLDLVRTGALAVVVLWHWVFTSVRWADDGPHVGNPVASTPGLWLLTWVLQVMPYPQVDSVRPAKKVAAVRSAAIRAAPRIASSSPAGRGTLALNRVG